jgi:hypothetical protein
MGLAQAMRKRPLNLCIDITTVYNTNQVGVEIKTFPKEK